MAGIGVNLENAPENSGVEHFFHLPAGCLHLSGVGLDLFDIWGRFLQRILDRFPVMTADPATIVREVNAVLAWKNETVVLKDTGSVDGPAVVLEVDGQGRLGVRTRKGVTFIRSGTLYPRVT
jgi:BirA family biotin operon repressor/biotin-[acetyl-CoA-carboxylase] ligase